MKKIIVIIIALLVVVILAALLFVASNRSAVSVSDDTDNSSFPTEKGPLVFPPNTDTGTGSGGVGNDSENGSGLDQGTSNLSGTTTDTRLINSVKAIKRISHGPVAGATVIGTVRGLNLFVRYLEKGSGHIYDYRPIGGGEDRISSKTIPRVLSAYFGNKGQTALLQYLDEEGTQVKNYLVRLNLSSPSTSTTTQENLSGAFIQDDLADIAVAPPGEERVQCPAYIPAGKTLSKSSSNDPFVVRKVQSFLKIAETGLYDASTTAAVMAFQTANNIEATGAVGPLTRTKINSIYCERSGGQVAGTRIFALSRGSGGAGRMGDFDHTTATTHFASPIEEWQVQWPSLDTLVLTTAPANSVPSYAYTLSAKQLGGTLGLKNLVPLIGDVKGLTLLASPTLDRVIYTSANPRGIQTLIRDKTGSSRSFPLVTWPAEKCAWSHVQKFIVYCAAPSGGIGAGEPDSWYQGRTVYSDNIYSVNLETDTVTLLYPAGSSADIDVKSIFVADDDSHIFVVNKRDGYLWQLALGIASED